MDLLPREARQRRYPYHCMVAQSPNSVPGVEALSEGVIAGVRPSAFGIADFDGDGDVDLTDLIGFLAAVDAAIP